MYPRTRRSSLMVGLVLFLAAPGATAGPEDQEAIDVSAVLHLRGPRALIHEGNLTALLRSYYVGGQTVEEVLGAPPEAIDTQVRVQLNRTLARSVRTPSGHANEVELEVSVPAEFAASDKLNELLRSLASRLGDVLRKRQEEDRQYVQRQIEQRERTVAKLESEQAERRKRLSDLLPRVLPDLNNEYSETLKALRGRIMELALRRDTLFARREAIVEQIAEISRRVEQRVGESEVIDNLRVVVESRRRLRDRVREMAEQSVASAADVLEAEERLALAKADLAREMQAARDSAGEAMIRELNRQLLELSIEEAEVGAQLRGVRDRLGSLTAEDVLELATQLDRLRRETALVEDELEQARDAVRELRSMLENRAPIEVTLIGLDE